MNHESRIMGILKALFVFLFLFIIHYSSFIIHPVSAQTCGDINGSHCFNAGESCPAGTVSYGSTTLADGSPECSTCCGPVCKCSNSDPNPVPICNTTPISYCSPLERFDVLDSEMCESSRWIIRSHSSQNSACVGNIECFARSASDCSAPPPPGCDCTYPENCTLSDGSAGVRTCSGVLSGPTCVFDGSGACTPNCTACTAVTAPPPPPGGGTFEVGPSPAGIPQLENLFISIVFAAVGLGFIVMFVFLVWAGFKYLTSGGEPKAVFAAHQTVTWALLGVIFLAIAWLVLQLIAVFTGINVTFFNIRTLF